MSNSYSQTSTQQRVTNEGHTMAANEAVALDLSYARPIVSAEQSRLRYGIGAPIVARVSAAGYPFAVFDTRQGDDPFTKPIIVASREYVDTLGERGFKGVEEHESIIVGNGRYPDRFTALPSGIATRHFGVAFNGLELIIKNFNPTGKTVLKADLAKPNDDMEGINDDYTAVAAISIQGHPRFTPGDARSPEGYLYDRPIIGRHSRSVRGGVYYSTNPLSEVAIVDHESRLLHKASDMMLASFRRQFGDQPSLQAKAMLQFVNAFTRQTLPYSIERAEKISQPYYAAVGAVNLSKYVKNKGGVCRHQNLLAALFIERLLEERHLIGDVSVERNKDQTSGHAWTVLHFPGGIDYIVDPAHNYVGTRNEANQRPDGWKYKLST